MSPAAKAMAVQLGLRRRYQRGPCVAAANDNHHWVPFLRGDGGRPLARRCICGCRATEWIGDGTADCAKRPAHQTAGLVRRAIRLVE